MKTKISLILLGSLFLTNACANKEILNKVDSTGAQNEKKTATLEIVHPKEISEALSAYKMNSTKVSFDLMSSVAIVQSESVSKLKNSVQEDYEGGKVTVIEGIAPGTYSHLLMWVDFLNESAFYSGAGNNGIQLKAGQVLRLEPTFLSASQAECPGGDEALHRLTFYPEKAGTNCQLPPFDAKNLACIAMQEMSFSCMVPNAIVHCTVSVNEKLFEIKSSTDVCGDHKQALMKKVCFDNAPITKAELDKASCKKL